MNDPKPKEKCFRCGGDGHWKRNYPKNLAQKMASSITESLVTIVIFILGTLNS